MMSSARSRSGDNSFSSPYNSHASFLVKQDALTFLKKHRMRKRKELMVKMSTYMFFGVELGFMAFFFTLSYKEFYFGTMLCILLNIINFCVFMIIRAVIKPVVKPINDPGILVWWMCCIRFGQT